MATTPVVPTSKASELAAILSEIGSISSTVLGVLGSVDPALALPDTVIEGVLKLATTALSAWTTASGVSITVESVQALLPNATPLSAPTA